MNEEPRVANASPAKRPRVYLAGPDVFLRDARAQGEKKKHMCSSYGLEGVFPLDVEIAAASLDRREKCIRISEANEDLLRTCSAVIANMTPFRGVSADVGTAFEMGFGRALGLAVFGYTNIAVAFTERTVSALHGDVQRDESAALRDAQGMAIEEWDLMDNLMLEGGIQASGGNLVVEEAPARETFTYLSSFEKCVRLAAGVLLSR